MMRPKEHIEAIERARTAGRIIENETTYILRMAGEFGWCFFKDEPWHGKALEALLAA